MFWNRFASRGALADGLAPAARGETGINVLFGTNTPASEAGELKCVHGSSHNLYILIVVVVKRTERKQTMSDKTNVKSDSEAKPEDLTPEELEQISGGTIPAVSTDHKYNDWVEV